MRNAGKLIGDDVTNIEPVAPPELTSISIAPNPTSGELRIMNYELGITNIQIFDIMGKTVHAQTSYPPSPYPPYPLSSEVNISHLPAGIYFVLITTEKGVVARKVVKK